MARNIHLHCWLTALSLLTFLNHASCAAGNLTRLTCNAYPIVRTKGVPIKADDVCTQYIDGDYFHTFSEEDCNENESLNCCDGVCKCCEGPNCTDDTYYALQISGGGSSTDGCGSARGRCAKYAKGKAVKSYSKYDCPGEYPYLNCCDGQCICCRASDVCPVFNRGAECEGAPLRFGEGSGASEQNVTIIV